MNQINFIIPVYNDWKSLAILLGKLNDQLSKNNRFCYITLIDDCSSGKINISIKKLKYIKKIEIIRLKKNVGSQNAIAIGLKYLAKIKKKLTIVVMDSDGEDDPAQINKMINSAEQYPNLIVTSNRTTRKESFLVRFLYRSHLIIAFLFTGKWISFGNYSALNSNNLKILLKNKSIWSAYPAAIIKNNNILRLFAARKKRFSGSSKITIYKLFFHSFRIISVFYLRVIIFSSIYIFLLQFLFYHSNIMLFLILILPIALLNFFIFAAKYSVYFGEFNCKLNYIDNVKKVKNIN